MIETIKHGDTREVRRRVSAGDHINGDGETHVITAKGTMLVRQTWCKSDRWGDYNWYKESYLVDTYEPDPPPVPFGRRLLNWLGLSKPIPTARVVSK